MVDLNRFEKCRAAAATPLSQAYWPISARSSGLYLPYGPRFFLPLLFIASWTSRFALAIAWEGIQSDSEPFGSGNPSRGFRYLRRAMTWTRDNLHRSFTLVTHVGNFRRSYSLWNIFCELKFRGCPRPRNYFNSEIFPIYGTYIHAYIHTTYYIHMYMHTCIHAYIR